MDRLEQRLRGIIALVSEPGVERVGCESHGMLLLCRGWLIERARTRRLSEELQAYREFASHWEFCSAGSDGDGCDCGLTSLHERFGGAS